MAAERDPVWRPPLSARWRKPDFMHLNGHLRYCGAAIGLLIAQTCSQAVILGVVI